MRFSVSVHNTCLRRRYCHLLHRRRQFRRKWLLWLSQRLGGRRRQLIARIGSHGIAPRPPTAHSRPFELWLVATNDGWSES